MHRRYCETASSRRRAPQFVSWSGAPGERGTGDLLLALQGGPRALAEQRPPMVSGRPLCIGSCVSSCCPPRWRYIRIRRGCSHAIWFGVSWWGRREGREMETRKRFPSLHAARMHDAKFARVVCSLDSARIGSRSPHWKVVRSRVILRSGCAPPWCGGTDISNTTNRGRRAAERFCDQVYCAVPPRAD